MRPARATGGQSYFCLYFMRDVWPNVGSQWADGRPIRHQSGVAHPPHGIHAVSVLASGRPSVCGFVVRLIYASHLTVENSPFVAFYPLRAKQGTRGDIGRGGGLYTGAGYTWSGNIPSVG